MAWHRTFEFREGRSSKFWRVRVDGKHLHVTYGRIGTDGKTQLDVFNSSGEAERKAAQKIQEKLGKGYYEVTDSRDRLKTEVTPDGGGVRETTERKPDTPVRRDGAAGRRLDI